MEKRRKKEWFKVSTTIQKWGNSLGVRIPKRIADDLEFTNGTEVTITKKDKKVIIEPVEDNPTLDELLAKCVGKNPNEEFFSEPMGREEI